MLSARELKAESQNFSQRKTPNVRLAAASTSEATNRENKMTKTNQRKNIYQKNTTRSETKMRLGPSGPKKNKQNNTAKGPSSPYVIKKTKWSTKQESKCIPRYSDTMWYECRNSTNCRETPYKSDCKGVGGGEINVRPL